MKVKRIRITEILRRIWLFSANKIRSESGSKQPTQLIIAAHNCHKIVNNYEENDIKEIHKSHINIQ